MTSLRQFMVIVIAALLLTGISGVSAVAAAPRTPATATSLTLLINSLINKVGDDTFSIIDLSSLVNPISPLTPLYHQASTTASSSGSGTSTQHFGPYASSSPDSGTCGNDWAQDTFNRHFTVFQDNSDGSLLVVEQFKDGNFTTTAGPSPGACQTGPGLDTVGGGVTGTLHGYFLVPLPPGTVQTNADPSCVAFSPSTPCTTTGFINSHFSPACYPTACPVTTFFFHYTAPITSTAPNSGLVQNEWKNASADRGGNTGDIRSS